MMRRRTGARRRAVVFAPFFSLDGFADRPRFVGSVLTELMSVDVVTSDFDHTRKVKREPRPCPSFSHVTYLKTRPYSGNISVARLISHLLFALKAAAYFRQNRYKYDVVYATVPLNILTWLVFSLAGTRTKIIDVVDIWPDVLPFSTWVRIVLTPVLAVWKWFFKSAVGKADLIMAVSDYYLKETAPYGNIKAKVARFFIGQNPIVSSASKQPIFTIAYVGNLGYLYDFDTLVEVLSEDGVRDRVQLFVVGTGERQDWLIKELERRKIQYQFFGVVFEPHILGDILRSCHVGFNGYVNTTAAFSYKASTYFAANLPIINSMRGDLQRLVIEQGLGANYEGGNRIALKECLLRLQAEGTATMAENCERFLTSQLDTSKIALAMKRFFVSSIYEHQDAPEEVKAGDSPHPKKLFHISTSPVTLMFLSRQVNFMQSAGFEVHVVASPGAELEQFGATEHVLTHGVPMTRQISPLRDFVAARELFKLFRRELPDIVHAHTPKAGLLGMIAARLAGVPSRIFHIHGLPHSTATGFTRFALRLSTRIACDLATQVLSVSSSVSELAVNEELCRADKVHVPAHGSINGVDAAEKFCPDRYEPGPFRASIELCGTDLAIGFLGRLVRDKGLCELFEAWARIRREIPHVYLVIAGEAEQRDALPESIIQGFHKDSRVRMIGWVKDTPPLYASLDILVLPSYREGFSTVLLEAAAMQVPAIANRVVGCTDVILDGITGTLVPPGDSHSLYDAMMIYLQDPALRKRHGRQARKRVLEQFKPEDVWKATLSEYRLALASAATHHARKVIPETVKRTFDIAAAASALLVLSPLLLLPAIAVRVHIGSPVLFRQTRIGLGGISFKLIKLRTMRDMRGPDGRPLPDEVRLTGLGDLLRRWSVDELPQLWNVVRGEMSLVGPRPLLPQYLPRYSNRQARRHEVQPGITGWAQVNGRNALSWDEKFELDVWYVEHRSFWLDCRILWMTVVQVLRHQGISAGGHATMPEFMGSAAGQPEQLPSEKVGQ